MDPVSSTVSIVALVTFAVQSSKLLYETVSSFKKLPKVIQHLKDEAGALIEVLQTLQRTLAASDIDLTALELPLKQCGKACKDFAGLVKKCSKHSGESEWSFRDWAKLKYLGEDVIGLQKLLAGYKATIALALLNTNIRKVDVTINLLQEYKDMIDDTTIRLEMHLQNILNKLESLPAQNDKHSGEAELERQDMEDEKEGTEHCLEICAEFLDYIENVERGIAQTSSASKANQSQASTQSPYITPQKIMVNTLSDLKLRVHSATALFEKVYPQPRNGTLALSEEQNVQRRELQAEFDGISKALEFCSEANELANSDRIHSFKNVYVEEDGLQVIVATMGDLLRVSDVKGGPRAKQIFGQMNDQSLQNVFRN